MLIDIAMMQAQRYSLAQKDLLVQYDLRQKYYEGKQPSALKWTPNAPNAMDDNVTLSCRKQVDTGAEWLYSKGPLIVDFTRQPKTTQDWALEAWPDDVRHTQQIEYATNGGIFGTPYYLINLPDADNDHPWLTIPDPKTVDVVWDQHNIRKPLKFTIAYPIWEKDPKTQRTSMIFWRKVIERQTTLPGYNGATLSWSIVEETSTDGKNWYEQETYDWPYPICPMEYNQNWIIANEFYGESDITDDVMVIVDKICYIYSHTIRHTRIYSNPIIATFGLNVDKSKSGIAPSTGYRADMPAGSSISMVEATSNNKDVIALLDELEGELCYRTGVPNLSPSRMTRLGQLSANAMEILYGPLFTRTQLKRNLYGPTEKRLYYKMGIIDKIAGIEQPLLHWPELILVDPLTARQIAAQDIAMKLSSVYTQQMKLGYNPSEENERIKKETPPAPPTPTGNPNQPPPAGQTPPTPVAPPTNSNNGEQP